MTATDARIDAAVVPDPDREVEQHADQERLRRREQQLGGDDVERAGDGFAHLHEPSIGATGAGVR